MRLVAIVTVGLMLAPAALHAQRPGHSIVPQKPKPTPYGLQISRSNDQHLRQADFESEEDMPELAPYLQSFEAAETEGGPYDFRLTEPLHDLGRAYREAGDMRRAMGNLRRALHVARVNDGLYTPAQLPLLAEMIDIHIALGQIGKADELHRSRYRLQKHLYAPGTAEREQATTEYVEWQRQAYLQGYGGHAYSRLLHMHEVHSEDIETYEEENPGDPRLIPHLYDRLQVEYLISQYKGEEQSGLQINVTGMAKGGATVRNQLEWERFKQLQQAEFNFRNGLNTLQDIIEIEESRENGDPMDLARAKLALGDWYLWWHKEERARQNYEQAWAVLSEDGSAETDPDALFPHPVELPVTKVFHADGTAPSEDVTASARVSLEVSRDGKAREIEILEQDPAGDMGARVVLFRLLKDVRFRPVVRSGQAVPYASLVREYRYQY
mgnify:CR=1 FL=1